MKISMWTAFLMEDSPEAAIETLADCGYRYSEFSDEHGKILMDRPNPMKAAAELSDFATDHGLTLSQAHLHLTADIAHPDSVTRRNFIDFLKKELEMYHILGVKAAVLHCGGRLACEQGMSAADSEAVSVASLAELCKSIEGSDIKIAIENIHGRQPFAADLLRIIKAVNRPELGICLDTGHLNIVQGDPCAFIDEVGKHLIALHIADNLGNADHHMLPCGRGTVNWGAFMAKLKSTSYDGLFNFEVPGERCPTHAIKLLKLKYALELGRLMYEMPE